MQNLSLICNKSIALLCDLRSELVLLGHVGHTDSADVLVDLHEGLVEEENGTKDPKAAVSAALLRVEESAARVVHLISKLEALVESVPNNTLMPYSAGYPTLLLQQGQPNFHDVALRLLSASQVYARAQELAQDGYERLTHLALQRRLALTLKQRRRQSRPSPPIHSDKYAGLVPDNVGLISTNLAQQDPDSSLTIVYHCGNFHVLRLSVANTLVALVLLRGIIIEQVAILGPEELTLSDEEISNDLECLWQSSRYRVFQQVAHVAKVASLYFVHSTCPDMALHQLLLWLFSYRNLFTQACCRCRRLLNNFSLPVWRDFRKSEAMHEACRV